MVSFISLFLCRLSCSLPKEAVYLGNLSISYCPIRIIVLLTFVVVVVQKESIKLFQTLFVMTDEYQSRTEIDEVMNQKKPSGAPFQAEGKRSTSSKVFFCLLCFFSHR